MRAVEVRDAFGLDHLCLVERPSLPLEPGWLRVRLKAASLNYRDLMMIQGRYNPRQRLPLIPCSDGAGEVIEADPAGAGPGVGTRVATLFAQDWLAGAPTRACVRSTLGGPLDGTLCEERLLPVHGVIPFPAHLSDLEAATLPCAALTAWSALVTQGGIKAGDTVLIQGSGGVSLFALQFARLHGARVIALTSSDEKCERLSILGAEHVINYRRTPEWGKVVSKMTGGVDHVVEVGGAGTLEQSIQATRMGGTISLIGVLAGGYKDLNIVPVFMNQLRIQGLFVGAREGFDAMNRAIALHALRPVLDQTFDLSDARAAFERLESGRHFGKITIRLAA